MTFSHLASYFEKLEATSSRLSLIEILSQLFKEVKTPEEIEKVIYLVQGRIAPFFEALEIGMAEKTVAQAIAQAYGVGKEDVLMEFDKKGDMGLAVQSVARNPKSQIPNLKISVGEVFDVLVTIAKTSGEGTVEKRI